MIWYDEFQRAIPCRFFRPVAFTQDAALSSRFETGQEKETGISLEQQ